LKITRISPLTGETNVMDLDIHEEAWAVWLGPNPPHVQDLFPHLTADEREFILTGYTKEDWDKIYPPEDEEDDSDAPAF